MKKIHSFTRFALSLCLLLSAYTLKAQSVEEIIANYLEITGGVENWKALKGVKMEGTLSMQGLDIETTMYKKAGNKMRMEISLQGKTLVQAYDGSEGWQINPFMGSGEPQKMSEEERKEMEKQAEFDDPFIDWQEKGHQVVLLGSEELEGTPCHKIQLTKSNGDVSTYFFDQEYFVPLMVRAVSNQGGQKMEVDTFMSDYKSAGNFVMPFSITSKVGGQVVSQISLETIEIDAELADDMFVYQGE